MFICITNAHGWGKAETQDEARAIAFRNSTVRNAGVLCRIWPCNDDAHVVNGFGDVTGVIGPYIEFERTSRRGGWKEIARE
jgi:hypothetical protein